MEKLRLGMGQRVTYLQSKINWWEVLGKRRGLAEKGLCSPLTPPTPSPLDSFVFWIFA